VWPGWDFEPGGGSLTLNGYSYEYTSATYPDPDDEDDEQPTILNLAVPTDADALEGDFVAIEPERSETVALVELAGFDEAVTALVPHTLQPMLTTGIRGDAVEAETVTLEQDGDTWIVTDVVGKPPVVDGSYLDETVQLPPQVIPNEGFDFFGNIAAEQIVGDRIQTDLSISEELKVFRYASDDPGETQPDPGSSIVSLSSENGLTWQVPTGDLDPETGEPLYRTTVSLPTRNEDEEGNPVAAEFRGRVIAEDITVLKGLEIQGDAQAGEVSRITPGALMQLDNIVEPPALAATLSYAPGT